MADTKKSIEETVLALAQQSKASDNITVSLETIEKSVKENANASNQLVLQGDQLSAITTTLNQSISKFTV